MPRRTRPPQPARRRSAQPRRGERVVDLDVLDLGIAYVRREIAAVERRRRKEVEAQAAKAEAITSRSIGRQAETARRHEPRGAGGWTA